MVLRRIKTYRILSGATVWHRAKRCWFGVSDSQESTSLPTGAGSWIRIGGGKMSRAGTWCVRKAIGGSPSGRCSLPSSRLCRSGWPYLGRRGSQGSRPKRRSLLSRFHFPRRVRQGSPCLQLPAVDVMTGSSFAAVAMPAQWGASEIPYNSDQAQITPAFPYQYVPDVAGGLLIHVQPPRQRRPAHL